LKSLVAVYGTLKRDNGNHQLLTRFNANLKGTSWQYGWHLMSVGPFPAALPSHSPKDRIEIEVYEVSAMCLTALDALEGTPNHYERVEVNTVFGRAWMYMYTPLSLLNFVDRRDMVPMIPSGKWDHQARTVGYVPDALERLLAPLYLRRMEDVLCDEEEGDLDHPINYDNYVDDEEVDPLGWVEVDGDVLPPPAPMFDDVEYPTPEVEEIAHAVVSNPAF
jgi:gamma-glutamylcyclotransferase (GGCT)/AIG2-like uncharacterized protein YtfP